MTRRTVDEIYTALIGAGFADQSARIMTAIALGESGGDDSASGDINIQTAEWGPSFGAFQIRTLKGATGTGGIRDIGYLASGLSAQARAAFEISDQGRDMTPWTVYTSGRWRDFLGLAQTASFTGGSAATLPASISDGLYSLVEPTIGRIRSMTIEALSVVLGVGLLAGGLFLAVRRR